MREGYQRATGGMMHGRPLRAKLEAGGYGVMGPVTLAKPTARYTAKAMRSEGTPPYGASAVPRPKALGTQVQSAARTSARSVLMLA